MKIYFRFRKVVIFGTYGTVRIKKIIELYDVDNFKLIFLNKFKIPETILPQKDFLYEILCRRFNVMVSLQKPFFFLFFQFQYWQSEHWSTLEFGPVRLTATNIYIFF